MPLDIKLFSTYLMKRMPFSTENNGFRRLVKRFVSAVWEAALTDCSGRMARPKRGGRPPDTPELDLRCLIIYLMPFMVNYR